MIDGMQAVILAGGLGVRLRPLTLTVPKPMVPVAGKPFLEHQIAMLREQGVDEVVLLTGYLSQTIEDHFGDGSDFGVGIRYSREQQPLGTGGGLVQARDLLRDAFLLLNGDSYLEMDYRALYERLLGSDAQAALVLYDNSAEDTTVLNNIRLDSDGYVTRYEKDGGEESDLTHVDAGVLAARKSVLALCPTDGVFSLEKELYRILGERRELLGHEVRQRFYDIGNPDRLRLFETTRN